MTQTFRPISSPPVQINGSGPPGKRARSQRRARVAVAAAGVAVLVLALVLFEALLPKTANQHPVLVATRSIRSGEVIGPADVRVVSVASAQLAAVPASRRAQVVGHTAGLDIGAGQPLVAEDVGGAPGPGPGESVVGVSLAGGRFPGGLGAGDSVVVVDTPGTGSTTGSAAEAALASGPGTELASGRVLGLARSSDGTRTEVALVVPAAKSDAVAAASATDSVSLVWVPR